MTRRFIFSLENENLENTEIGTNTDPAEVITEDEAEIKNIETELGEVSLEGERLFMAKEALDELIETTQDITEPTPVELSLIQSNIETIARINNDAVPDLMPLAENVVSVESYGKGRGLLALGDAKKTMWERIKEWFAKMWGWVKEKATKIKEYFFGVKKEAEELKEKVKSKDNGKITISKPKVAVIKDTKTGKDTKIKVVDQAKETAAAAKEAALVAKEFSALVKAVGGKTTKAELEEFSRQMNESDTLKIGLGSNSGFFKSGVKVKMKRTSKTAAKENFDSGIEGIEVTYEDDDTPVTIDGIEVCEHVLEGCKSHDEMTKFLEEASTELNRVINNSTDMTEENGASILAEIVKTLSANISTLSVTVSAQIARAQKRQLNELQRGFAAA